MKKPAKSKKPSKEDIRSAVAILDAMRDGGHQVQAMVLIRPMLLTFEGTIEKQEDRHVLVESDSDFQIGVLPQLCDSIMFNPDGGVLLAWKENVIVIDVKERSAEELTNLFPDLSKLIH